MPATAVIGRDHELGSISAFLERIEAGPSALVLSGEPGIGKTVLREEGVSGAKRHSRRVLVHRSVEAETSLSFTALSDLLAPVFEDVAPSLAPCVVARSRSPSCSPKPGAEAWAPPPALGRLSEEITDPVTIMLWGVTDERVREWLSSDGRRAERLTGCAASAGVADGLARVLLRVDQIGELRDDEILVAPVTSPSWTPVFHRIAGAVLDTGGIMCHAAIVAREYGLPAVVGTGTATKRIRTGDLLHVDGSEGVVTIVDGAGPGS